MFAGDVQLLERCDEAVVSNDFGFDSLSYLLVRDVVLAELLVEVVGFRAGIGHVECEVGLLGIEHKADLLASLHVVDQLGVLASALLAIALEHDFLLFVGLFQFEFEHA